MWRLKTLVVRSGLGPRLIGQLGLGVQISASVQIIAFIRSNQCG